MGVTTSTANAGQTYVPISTTTLVSAVSSYSFSSIPSTYTDLVLIVNASNSSGSAGISFQLNSDAANDYSLTYLAGDGSTPFSGRQSNQASAYAGRDSVTAGIGIAHFMNYSNTNTYKTILSRGNDSGYIFQYVNLWRTSGAINNIKLYNDNSVNFSIGSIFTIYGIKAA